MTTTAAVLGRGRLGRSLHGALTAAGIRCTLAPGTATPSEQAPSTVFLAVPDHALGAVAERLAGAGVPAAAAVVHLSGACRLDVLAPLAERGRAVGSFHPLQPFPVVRPPDAFSDTLVAVDATTGELTERLAATAHALGARPRRVGDDVRAPYHAAAVMASSMVVALVAQTADLLAAIGWSRDEALRDLMPLLRGTVDNLDAAGLPEALSGPARRGEVEVLARHVASLRSLGGGADAAAIEATYRTLGRVTAELAAETGLDPERVAAMRRVLDRTAAAAA